MSDSFETLAIHAGQEPDPLTGSVVPPVYLTSTFKQDGVGGLRGGYEYSRSANPTRTALEQCLAAIEGGNRALAFASGMAAEDCLLRTVLKPGDHVLIPDDAYGGTYRLFARVLSGWGIDHTVVPVTDPALLPPKAEKVAVPPGAPTKIVAIGVSTGGPQAMEYLLSQLPGDFPGTIAVVQHMPDGFTDMFARRLHEVCPLRVKEAQSGDLLQPGRVLICPGNRHMKVKRLPLGDVVVLTDEARVNGHRPSADVLMRSVAEEFRSQAIGVLMTGMGDDGAEGLGAIKKEGGMTIAQSEESCVVFGMPKAAIERGYAIRVVGLDVLGATLQALCGRAARAGN